MPFDVVYPQAEKAFNAPNGQRRTLKAFFIALF